MLIENLTRLNYLIEIIPGLLNSVEDEMFNAKPTPDKWSKKEILGHLIDSATNNHQRFVRSQFEEIPNISYNQNEWNKYNFYSQIDKNQLIDFWRMYNKHISTIIELSPKENLLRECNTGGDKNFTVEFLFNDYLEHLEYHLKQMVNY